MATVNIPSQYQLLKTRLEQVVKKILSPKHILENDDLNDYFEVGRYRCDSNAKAGTLLNCPVTDAFGMVVERVSAYNGVKQTITTYDTVPVQYFRTMYYLNNELKTSGWQLLYEDTGWKDLSLPSGFTHYSETNRARYRRVGKVVEVRGAVKNTNQISANTDKTIATIGDISCKPSQNVNHRQQGSSINTFLLTIDTNGDIVVNRYGATSVIAIPAGAWLNVHTTFLVD